MATWSVRIDADGATYNEQTDGHLRDRLAARSPAIGAGHLNGEPVDGRITIQISIDAATLHAAQEKAHREVAAALADLFAAPRIVRMETLTEEDFAAEVDHLPPLVGASEVATMLGVSRQRVHTLIKDNPSFPVAQRTASGPVWSRRAIEEWDAQWDRKQGRPSKHPAPA